MCPILSVQCLVTCVLYSNHFFVNDKKMHSNHTIVALFSLFKHFRSLCNTSPLFWPFCLSLSLCFLLRYPLSLSCNVVLIRSINSLSALSEQLESSVKIMARKCKTRQKNLFFYMLSPSLCCVVSQNDSIIATLQ